VFSEYNKVRAEFSQAPFWFWNDELNEDELLRQMQDFCRHGVYAFVIHPRAGLPKSIAWLSDRMIDLMRFTIEQAAKMNMQVFLYDEGMYPSGSSAGQVVEGHPEFRPRGLFAIDLDEAVFGQEINGFLMGVDGLPEIQKDQNLIGVYQRAANGHRVAVVDRFIKPECTLIRGLHFVDEEADRRPNHKEVLEERPPLADLLNPDAMQRFIHLVYQRFYDEFGDYFGTTIPAIFTDEPSIFGKQHEVDARVGNATLVQYASNFLGYDFAPHLLALWFDDEPDADRFCAEYHRAIQARLEETYYSPISTWCDEHGIALTGHPQQPDAIGHLRHFQLPGQDIVLNYINPGKDNALEGSESTVGKCASSAMIHLGCRRNMNEFAGGYGHGLTYDEYRWLALWLLIRGCNLLMPHAFYYSIRGPRIDERPRDVGPNSPWWDGYAKFAEMTGWLCWLNTDSQHICEVAVLGTGMNLPWKAAKVCFQNQFDFNYLTDQQLLEEVTVTENGIHISGMTYRVLIVKNKFFQNASQTLMEAIDALNSQGLIIQWDANCPDILLEALNAKAISHPLATPACSGLRIRQILKNEVDYLMVFNEGEQSYTGRLEVESGPFPSEGVIVNMDTGETSTWTSACEIEVPAHGIFLLSSST